MKIVKKAYKFRIYPTLEQISFFAKSFGCVRKVHNLMLDDRKKGYEEYKSTGIKTKYPTPAKYKEEYPYLKEVDSLALANAQLNLEKAFKNFLRNKEFGFPKYKCKSNPVQSYTTNNQDTIYIDKGYIKLPKLKSLVKIRLHREVKGIIKSVTVSRNSINHYFVSILCEEEIEELPKANKNIGIDLGIKDFAIMSDNTKVENLKLTKKYEDKLKREQRKMSRSIEYSKSNKIKLKECKNFNKKKLKVQRLFYRLNCIRDDYNNNKMVDEITRAKLKYITIEDLKVSNMMKNKHLSKAIQEQNFYAIRTKLINKCKERNIELRLVDTFYPSSKTCSCCGSIKKDLKLNDRIYKCNNCGLEIDRDYNASINLEKAKIYKVIA